MLVACLPRTDAAFETFSPRVVFKGVHWSRRPLTRQNLPDRSYQPMRPSARTEQDCRFSHKV